eukprot:8852677-Pyramimonas_sp.AAC.1
MRAGLRQYNSLLRWNAQAGTAFLGGKRFDTRPRCRKPPRPRGVPTRSSARWGQVLAMPVLQE